MSGRLDGRVVIVTGGANGLGRGIARRLAAEAATVVVADVDEAAGRRACEEIAHELGGRATFRRTDVADERDARAMVDETAARHGGLDALVCDAQGYAPLARLEDKTTAMFEHTMGTGFYGTLWTMQAAVGHLRDRGGGSIVTFGSQNGLSGAALLGDYNVTKEAIRGLTRSAAREWGRHGIRVNAILPLGMSPAHEAFEAANPEFARRLREALPLGYVGDAEDDIGSAVLFLVGDDSRYVTGTTLHVDGGLHLNALVTVDIRTWEPPADEPAWPPAPAPSSGGPSA